MDMIPLKTVEIEYTKLFPSHTGISAEPLRMVLGSLLNTIEWVVRKETQKIEKGCQHQGRETDCVSR